MAASEPVRTVLPNGCVVITQQLSGAPLVSLHGFVKGGSAWDEPEKTGRMALMAQVLRRGTETKTAQQIDDALERRGAELNLSVSGEGVSFGLSCLPQDFSDCAALLAEILLRPTFPEEETEKQRVRHLNSLRDAMTRPEEVSRHRFFQMAYPPEHPFHHPPEGAPQTVETLTRSDLVSAYRQALRPSDAIVCIVGDLPVQKMTETVTQMLSQWQSDDALTFELPPAPLPERTFQDRVFLPDKTQCWVMMGHKGLRRTDERFYAASVLATILGAGWGRLFTEIRDNQGLAYAVGASLQAGLGEGPFFVRMGVKPEQIEKAIESVLAELNKMLQEPPAEEEVADAKSYLLGRLVLSMETTGGIAALLLSCELFGLGLDYPKRAKGFYDPITPEKVHEVAQSFLHPDRMAVAIAGP